MQIHDVAKSLLRDFENRRPGASFAHLNLKLNIEQACIHKTIYTASNTYQPLYPEYEKEVPDKEVLRQRLRKEWD